jgi:glycyl-tRNA synthetase beta chain
VDLRALVARAASLQPVPSTTAAAELWDYIVERLRAYLLDASGSGVTTEMFDAVRASDPSSPLDFGARLAALSRFLALPEAASLTAANKRIANILRKSTSVTPDAARQKAALVAVQQDLLQEPAEKALYEAVAEALPDVERALSGKRDYAAALTRLASLRPTVDAFFDGVMVNAEDPALRNNRLALLAQLRAQFSRIADLSCLPG